MILTNFENNIDKFVKDLLPYYKRYFGLNSPTSIERTLKQLGEKGIFRTYNDAKKALNVFKDKQLYDTYINIVDNKINGMFNQVKQVEQKPVEEPKEVNNKEIDNNIKKMEQEVQPEEQIEINNEEKQPEEKVEENNNEQEVNGENTSE